MLAPSSPLTCTSLTYFLLFFSLPLPQQPAQIWFTLPPPVPEAYFNFLLVSVHQRQVSKTLQLPERSSIPASTTAAWPWAHHFGTATRHNDIFHKKNCTAHSWQLQFWWALCPPSHDVFTKQCGQVLVVKAQSDRYKPQALWALPNHFPEKRAGIRMKVTSGKPHLKVEYTWWNYATI